MSRKPKIPSSIPTSIAVVTETQVATVSASVNKPIINTTPISKQNLTIIYNDQKNVTTLSQNVTPTAKIPDLNTARRIITTPKDKKGPPMDEESESLYNICLAGATQTPNEAIMRAESFDGIVGLTRAKEIIRSNIFAPLENPAVYEKNRKRYFLFTGPPGTGKTAVVNAIAKELITNPLYKNEVIVNLFQPNTADLFSSYKNQSAKILLGILRCASRVATESEGSDPANIGKGLAIVFFDEMESFAKSRTDSTQEGSIIPTFLSYLDGAETPDNLIVFGATNLAKTIDTAILSRFSQIYVGPPDLDNVNEFYNRRMNKMVIDKFRKGLSENRDLLKITSINADLVSILRWGFNKETINNLSQNSEKVKATGRLLVQIFNDGLTENGNDLIYRNVLYPLSVAFPQIGTGNYFLSLESVPPELWYTLYKLYPTTIKFSKAPRVGFFESVQVDGKNYINSRFIPFINIDKDYPFFVDIFYDESYFDKTDKLIRKSLKIDPDSVPSLYDLLIQYKKLSSDIITSILDSLKSKCDILIKKYFFIK